MNKKRRNEIALNLRTLVMIKNNFESILFDEQNSYDNIPENLQNSDRAIESEEAIDCLDNAVDYIETAIDNLSDAIDSIEEI